MTTADHVDLAALRQRAEQGDAAAQNKRLKNAVLAMLKTPPAPKNLGRPKAKKRSGVVKTTKKRS